MHYMKTWHACGNFLGDIAVICMKPDYGKRIAHQLQAGKRLTEHLSHFRERSRISGSYAAAVSSAMAGAPWAFNHAAGSRSGRSSGAGSCISLPKTHSK